MSYQRKNLTKESWDALSNCEQIAFISELHKELTTATLTVVFTKADGTERTMRATLNEAVVPQRSLDTDEIADLNEATTVPEFGNSLCVWDVDLDAWRSFRFDRLKEIS